MATTARCLCYLVLIYLCLFAYSQNFNTTIHSLLNKIKATQIQHPSSYFPFVSEEKFKGLFPSWIHLNFHGDFPLTLLRREFKFFDNNYFVTSWILQMLLEAHQLGTVDLGQEKTMIKDALDAILKFRDRNFPLTTPITDFWRQKYDSSSGMYIQTPTNIAEPLKFGVSLAELLEEFAKFLGFHNIYKDMKLVVNELGSLLAAFSIPADFDDTSVSLALGGLLKRTFPDLYQQWLAVNANFGALSRAYVAYSYQPFVRDSKGDTITNALDPRSYFWMRNWLLHKNSSSGSSNLKLVTTWVQNLAETKQLWDTGVRMPFNSNNVDGSVCANGVFGITVATLFLCDDTEWFTPELQQLYSDTSELLAWITEEGVLNWRPDLVLLYYPPIYDFYWFVARSVFMLRTTPSINHPIVRKVQSLLTRAMMTIGTRDLLARAQWDSHSNWVYWDDFLGNNDTDNGKSVNYAEDRLFSTSMAINALIDTWTTTVSSNNPKRLWLPQTPSTVKNAVIRAVNWLNHFVLRDDYLPENAFFSGSVKGLNDIPLAYPANRIELLNGTSIKPSNMSEITPKVIDVVQGIIDEKSYQQLLNRTWFGFKTPLTFAGYNAGDLSSTFPFWSSPPLTWATALLSLSKYSVIVG